MIIGISLLAAGSWYLLSSLEPDLLGFDRIWPALLVVVGLSLFVMPSDSIHPFTGAIWTGTFLLLLGLFLLVFTLGFAGLSWADTGKLWPVFLVITGISFYAAYIRGGRAGAPLYIVSMLAVGIGVFLLPLTLGVVRGGPFQQVWQMAPVLLPIILGLLVGIRHVMDKPTIINGD